MAAGTKAAERAAAKAAKLQEQVDFEATFANMSEQEIALIAFQGGGGQAQGAAGALSVEKL